MKKQNKLKPADFAGFLMSQNIAVLELDGATVIWDGGDPKLAWGEGNDVARFIFKDDLGGLGSFLPGALNGSAVLEDVGGAGTNGLDDVVIVVRIKTFVDHHDGYSRRSKLFGKTTIFLRRRLGRFGIGTVVDQVFFSSSVGAAIGIGLDVVLVNRVKCCDGAEVDGDLWDER